MFTKTFSTIALHIGNITTQSFEIKNIKSLAGGDINQAFVLQSETKCYFVKLNRRDWVDMFAAEFAGLQALIQTQTVKTPQPIHYGQTEDHSFLILEYLQLHHTSAQSDTLLGQQLAQMHKQTQNYFGWHIDNTIGSTPQLNPRTQNWLDFYREQRLSFQLQLTVKNGYDKKLQMLGMQLCAHLEDFFMNYTPQPSLLHGDLWGGNVACDHENKPIIFDPACYFGDREADLAMTELFGGFGQNFYAAYNNTWSLDAGYNTRKNLYNLYHVLNHVNLFGEGYIGQAEQMIRTLLAYKR